MVIDTRRTGTLQDKDILVSDGTVDLDRGFEREKFGDMARRELDPESACQLSFDLRAQGTAVLYGAWDAPLRDGLCELGVTVAREELDGVAGIVHPAFPCR